MGSLLSSTAADDWKSDARHAMEASRFCVICGGPFDVEGDVHNINPKDMRFEWLYSLRLLGSIADVAEHMVASEGLTPNNVSEIPGIFLSEIASFSLAGSGYFRVPGDAGQDDIWFDALSYAPDHGTLFPLHQACIATSCRAIGHYYSRRKGTTSKLALETLYGLLSTRFIQRKCRTDEPHEASNDILNLCFSSDQYGPRSVLSLSRLEWWGAKYDVGIDNASCKLITDGLQKFYTNPIEVGDITTFVRNILQSSPHRRNEPEYTPRVTREPQTLERLPKELLDAVCSYLSIEAVIALHGTSKALALQIPLDSAFWRDCLRDGNLHPHIWDLDTKRIEQCLSTQRAALLDTTAYWDWKSAAKLLSVKRFPINGCDERLRDMPDGFWNRCRIWAIIEEALEDQEDLEQQQRLLG